MTGKHRIIVQSKRLKYDFQIRRNITVIRGNSATGKTTLVNMIRDYYNNGEEISIQLQCDKKCVVLEGRDWEEPVLFIADGAAFGPEMNEVINNMKYSGHYALYVPESFEWLILKSGLIKGPQFQTILHDPSQYIESEKYFSWERYFTALLTQLTIGTAAAYRKTQWNPYYGNDFAINKILLETPIKI